VNALPLQPALGGGSLARGRPPGRPLAAIRRARGCLTVPMSRKSACARCDAAKAAEDTTLVTKSASSSARKAPRASGLGHLRDLPARAGVAASQRYRERGRRGDAIGWGDDQPENSPSLGRRRLDRRIAGCSGGNVIRHSRAEQVALATGVLNCRLGGLPRTHGVRPVSRDGDIDDVGYELPGGRYRSGHTRKIVRSGGRRVLRQQGKPAS